MKIICKILSVVLLFVSLSQALLVSSTNGDVYEFTNPDITVTFDSSGVFTEQKKEEIAYSFAGFIPNDNGEKSTNNIICSIFGHDLSSGTVTVVQHKVYIRSPRCVLSIYDVTGCSRCDYIEQVLVGSSRIICHPEELPLPE